MTPRVLSMLAPLLCALSVPAFADNWPQWRGPTSNGVASGDNYPTEWSAEDNVAWKIKLPAPGSSTPAVWNDSIFITSARAGKNSLLCLDRKGQQRWDVALGTEHKGKHKKATSCNPSPATDGAYVFAYFKSGDLACTDFQGNVVWQKNLQQEYGEDTLWWDLGTSPVLTDKYVIVAVIQSGPSYLVAFAKESGKRAWKRDRNLGAPEEAAQTYATPMVIGEPGRETLIVLGADHVTAHRATDGEELWRVGGMNPAQDHYFRSIASPAVGENLVIAPYARGETVTAIQLGGKGDVTDSRISWKKTGIGADVPTPIVADGKVYLCGDKGRIKGQLICLDLKSGEQLWARELPKNRNSYSASPVLASGHIFVTREDGVTFVVALGPEPRVIAENRLGDEFTAATPVFVDGQILIRTFEHLYCIDSKS